MAGVQDLFLAFTGYSIGSDGSEHFQYWEANDLNPVITHLNQSTGLADGEMFTDFLFLALAVKNSSGVVKHIARNNNAPAAPKDWQIYLQELVAARKNLNALYAVALNNGLGRQIKISVWIGLPYPHPRVFAGDTGRIAAVQAWIDDFLTTWNSAGYSDRLTLRGFYWIQESIYYHGPVYNDGFVVSQVNNHIHNKHVNNSQLQALWLPYQTAAGWDHWKTFGFDLSLLQPSYYFDPTRSLETGVADACANGQGVVMEMDLAVTWDSVKRARFIEYLDKGTAGGYDSTGRYFGPYMKTPPAAWYVGGWYWSMGVRNHAVLKLYNSADILYDKIRDFVKGTYKAGTAR